MAETNTTQKAVTLESLAEVSKIVATKEEVKQQIADAVATCANIAYATTEEVLALFKPKAPVDGGSESGGGTEGTGTEA